MNENQGIEPNDQLLRLLLDAFRDGVFTVNDLLPAAGVLLPRDADSTLPLTELYDALKDRSEPELTKLCDVIRQRLLHACFMAHAALRTTGKLPDEPDFADLPKNLHVDWKAQPSWPKALHSLLPLLSDLAFAMSHDEIDGLTDCIMPQMEKEFKAFANDATAMSAVFARESRDHAEDAGEAIRSEISGKIQNLSPEPPQVEIYEVYKPG